MVKAVVDELRPALERNIPGELLMYLQCDSYTLHALRQPARTCFSNDLVLDLWAGKAAKSSHYTAAAKAMLYFTLPIKLQLTYSSRCPPSCCTESQAAAAARATSMHAWCSKHRGPLCMQTKAGC